MQDPAPIRIRSRGYLPHWEREGGTYFLTWRLEDSLPRHVLEQFDFERWEILDHLIRDAAEFHHYVEYTLQNPVVAGLCERWEDWPWSGRHPGCPDRF